MNIAVEAVPVPREVLDEGLDAIQQGLFAVALRLRSLQISAVDEAAARELERLEIEVDGLIRQVRCRASGRPV